MFSSSITFARRKRSAFRPKNTDWNDHGHIR